MKNLVLFVSIFQIIVSAESWATTLEFDLTGVFYKNNRELQIDVPKLNRSLAKKGLDGLPEKIVVGKNAKAYGKLLLNRIEAANKGATEELRFVIDNGYLYEYPPICYRGDATDVPAIMNGMLDTFLNSEQGILALRYGKETIIHDDRFKSKASLNEAFEGGNNETKAWLNFDQHSRSVLVMSDLGPQGDGTELYTTYIKPCR